MSYPFLSAVEDDFSAVDDLIRENLSSEVPLVEEIAAYLIESGGKRLRPLLVLLCAKACGYNNQDHIKLAAVIEFLHTAMLLHDDVVDKSDLRRGRENRERGLGQPTECPGRRLFTLASFRDDGRDWQHARHADPVQGNQCDL